MYLILPSVLLIHYTYMKMFSFTKCREVASLDSIFSSFSFTHLQKNVFFNVFLNLDLPEVAGSVHLKLSRPLPSQQSNLIIGANKILFDILVTDVCNVVEEGWNYISPPIT